MHKNNHQLLLYKRNQASVAMY